MAIRQAVQTLKTGGIVAYPTEAVYGFGVDPFQASAVERLSKLKNRPSHKGYILIAEDLAKCQPLIDEAPYLWAQIQNSWPGPTTWVFKKSADCPNWLAEDGKIAIRVPDHPLCQQLLSAFGKPIVSTSANLKDMLPCRDYQSVYEHFQNEVACILEGKVGRSLNPSKLIDALTGKVYRGA